MSNGRMLELLNWGDGTTRLSFWDSEAGEDVTFILNEDGTADMESYDQQIKGVDLVQQLRKMAGMRE